MKQVHLDSIERMYADELFDAVESGETAEIMLDGKTVAYIVHAMPEELRGPKHYSRDGWLA